MFNRLSEHSNLRPISGGFSLAKVPRKDSRNPFSEGNEHDYNSSGLISSKDSILSSKNN